MDDDQLKASITSVIVGLEADIDEWQEPLEELNEIDRLLRQAGSEMPPLVADAIVALENDQDTQAALASLNELHATL